jgi:transketolase
VLSKGHCVEALYVTLEARGFLSSDVLDTLGQFGSILSGHPTIEVPGIEVNSGALGHGLSIGVGMALAAKMNIGAFQNSYTPTLLHSRTPTLLHSYTPTLLNS